MIDRRNFLKSCAAFASCSGAALPLQALAEKPAADISGSAAAPEWVLDPATGAHRLNPDFAVRHSVCLQCHGECGIRAKVSKKTGKLIRLTGNPWHPNTKIAYTGMESDAAATASDPGTLCARGASGLQVLYDPCRIRVPLKRAGARGENRWIPISWETLIREVTEGGKLFDKTGDPLSKGLYIKGFRDLYKRRGEPISKDHPDYGRVTNGLVLQGGRIVKSRKDFQNRFAKSFGTVNSFEHTNICEQSHHIATGEMYGGKHNCHADLCNSEFVMFWGTAPGEANFPMQTLGKYSAEARKNGCKIVVVDPVLPVTVTQNPNMTWVPVKPGTDGALAMAMVRIIIEENRFNANFLSRPNAKAAEAAGETTSCDASFLVVSDPAHADFGKFLTGALAGIAAESKEPAVIDKAKNAPALSSSVSEAVIDFEGTVNGVKAKSAFRMLKESAFRLSVAEYSSVCGVSEKLIRELAREMTSHGRKAVAEFYRGIAQHPNGYYTGTAINAINALVGNLNWKGGASTGGGSYAYNKGRYDLGAIPNLVPAAEGLRISREKAYYEKSSEFKQKTAEGKNPYPARRPWFPFSGDVYSEIIPSALEGYPYKADILLWHMATPLYAAPGQANAELLKKIRDPRNIPLIISSDIVIGDSTLYADYVVPDITYLERFVHVGVPDTVLVKGIGVRSPVVEPLTGKTKDGRHFCYENFLIDVAKSLGMAGFGENALKASDGTLFPLNRPEDWYLKATANVAFDGGACADATADDIAAADLKPFFEKNRAALKDEEWPKALFVMSRGGKFEPAANRYKGDKLGHMNKKPVSIYSEKVALGRDSMTGRRFSGVALWTPSETILGKPVSSLDAGSDFTIVTRKTPLQSHSRLPACTVIREIQPDNAAEISVRDGKRLGLKTGDRVTVVTATGKRTCKVRLLEGVAPGVLNFTVGFGHTGYGAASGSIGGKAVKGLEERRRGVNLNPVMRLDPDVPMMALMDPIGGSASFFDTRAKIVKG